MSELDHSWPGGSAGRAALGAIGTSSRGASLGEAGATAGITYGQCQGVRSDGRAWVLLDGASAVLALQVEASLPREQLVGRRVVVAGDDPGTWIVIGAFGTPVNPAFLVYKTGAAQSIAPGIGVDVKVDFTDEALDSHGYYDLASDRFLPLIPGWYGFVLSFYLTSATDQTTIAGMLYKNGARDHYAGIVKASGTGGHGVSGVGMLYLDGVDDYAEMYVTQEGAGALDLAANAQLTRFAGWRIG